jgi:cyclic pyranopterin phosphate synthase
MGELSHIDKQGKVRMVDVGRKEATARTAVAGGRVAMSPELVGLLRQGEVAKGNVLAVAKTAGILAAKRTADLIPLCHPLQLDHLDVDFEILDDAVEITARVKLIGRTGAEMEALTAVAVAGLTIYDMCKAVDKRMVLGRIRLLEKSGGKSGTFKRE